MTRTTPSRDAAALLASIVKHPDEDMPRLMYADWLDEQDVRVVCPKCKGTGEGIKLNGSGSAWKPCDCSGVGSVVDREPQDRAEFIRLSVELAKPRTCDRETEPDGCDPFVFDAKCVHCQKLFPLRRRESELLDRHRGSWAAAPCLECEGNGWRRGNTPATATAFVPGSPCPTCGGSGDLLKTVSVKSYTGGAQAYAPRPHDFRRGFLHGVTAALAEWGEEVEVRCEDCLGTGDVNLNAHERTWENCPKCGGDGTRRVWKPSKLATYVCRLPGVAELRAGDREPEKSERSGQVGFYCWRQWAWETYPYSLPSTVHAALPGGKFQFPTPDAAHAALARALFALARGVS